MFMGYAPGSVVQSLMSDALSARFPALLSEKSPTFDEENPVG